MAQFILLLRDNGHFDAGATPEEIEGVIQRYANWRNALGKKVVHASKLHDNEGRVMRRGDKDLVVMDGPYTESKELLGGYFVVEAADYDEAVKLSRDCPHFDFGSVEIRQLDLPTR
jgi:hypothetical protein